MILNCNEPCPNCGSGTLAADEGQPVRCSSGCTAVRIIAAAERDARAEGRRLLSDIRDFTAVYVVLPSAEVADLLALWVLHTWAFDAAQATPYLRIVSAVPECGKSLLMELLGALCRRGWLAVSPSSAVLYRKIDRDTPTLLLDEMDNYPLDERREALAVLNAGYRKGMTVSRVGPQGELQDFKPFCPKAFAGIDSKALAPALLSRCITLRLERKSRSDEVERWLSQRVAEPAEQLQERCSVWAQQRYSALVDAEPHLPDRLGGRASEVWWSLLAIAEDVGGDWPGRAQRAARVLSAGGDDRDGGSLTELLLADLRAAFDKKPGALAITTSDLLGNLNADDERPWGARRDGQGLDARGLARMLRPFGIRPRTIGSGKDSAKGYRRDQFSDAFARYLPTPELSVASVASVASQSQSQSDATAATAATANPRVGSTAEDEAA